MGSKKIKIYYIKFNIIQVQELTIKHFESKACYPL